MLKWKEIRLPALETILSTGRAQPLPRETWPSWAIAPFFSLARGVWIPYALTWNEQSGEFRRVRAGAGSPATARRWRRAGFSDLALLLVG